MSQQPPSGNLQWFKPQPNADGKFAFPDAQYLVAIWVERTKIWVYSAGTFEFDENSKKWMLCDECMVSDWKGQIELQDIDWLARLDDGRPDPQQTLFTEQEGGE